MSKHVTKEDRTSEEERQRFQEAAAPLIEYLRRWHPMVQAIVNSEGAELVEGIMSAGPSSE